MYSIEQFRNACKDRELRLSSDKIQLISKAQKIITKELSEMIKRETQPLLIK